MKKPKQPNKHTIKSDIKKRYTIINNNLLLDNRLTHAERNVLTILIMLSDQFYISLEKTSDYLGIAKNTFKKMLKNYKLLGYLKIEKIGNNYNYYFKDESDYITTFKPYLIEKYTLTQLNALYNNSETPTKYKNLIKKYFDALSQPIETYNNVLTEIKSFEMPKDIYKKQIETEQEQQNEIDIIEYIKNH